MPELKFGWKLHFIAEYHLPGKYQEVVQPPKFASAAEAQTDLITELMTNPKDYSPSYEFWVEAFLDEMLVQSTKGPIKAG